MPATVQDRAVDLVLQELTNSYRKFPTPFVNHQEARGVIDEEVDELHDAMRANDVGEIKKEAKQVAAMAIRLLIDLQLA